MRAGLSEIDCINQTSKSRFERHRSQDQSRNLRDEDDVTCVTPGSQPSRRMIKRTPPSEIPSLFKERQPISLFEDRGPVPAEQPQLTWRDSVRPVVLVVATAAILHYTFSRFIFGPFVATFLFGPSNPQILPAGSGELAIVAVIAGLILVVKARDRLVEWTYCLPAVIVALWSVGLFTSDAAREATRERIGQQYLVEMSDLTTKMQDPTFLIKLRPPLSLARQIMVMRALGDGERVPGTPLTSAEVHAILTNLGSDPEIENGVAASLATSADDLQWLAVHGRNSARLAVAKNPHTSHETLLHLMNDPDFGIRYVTGLSAAGSGCDAEIARIFWDRENSTNLPNNDVIYRQMAANPCTPKDILRKLKTYPAPVGASAAATLHSLSAR